MFTEKLFFRQPEKSFIAFSIIVLPLKSYYSVIFRQPENPITFFINRQNCTHRSAPRATTRVVSQTENVLIF
ncbi:hypothetical protein JF634_03505 [Simonsiella muelleri]|uniref:hypothetical protein n=1 Tax=Simonsiella muelleri TaxID=72 RepID=UPI0001D0A32E|nr:hypothetical protein [Simonsiella muelleri]AUX60603.1 hypothetical protein BWP33_01325 [Simonsiella muelleri ATCC 29453]UBQ54576.1 hypothetical protein JF634_03505 [Simonsiella muelleri]